MSLELPAVSIIIAAYEETSYLPETIESILQQTSGDFEILVFSDDYRQIYTWSAQQPDYRCRFILQDNLGLSHTLNHGILESKGKYLAFVKAGNFWHPSKMQKQMFCLDRDRHLGLIHSWSMLLDHQGKSSGRIAKQSFSELLTNFPQNAKTTLINNLFPDREILAQNYLDLSSVMVRRECFQTLGLFEPNLQLIPDWEMWIRLSHYYQFRAIAEPLVYCRYQQYSSFDWLILETDLQTIIEKAYARLPSEFAGQKHLSYAYASVFLAKNVLQHKNPDLVIAQNYWYQALQHDPLIVFSREFCQLRGKIFTLYWLQSDFYSSLQLLIRALVRYSKVMIRYTRQHGQNIINWMLEEDDSINLWKNRKVKRQGKD